ncbi:MAG: hypothetical protein V1845_02815 [bacterium]
MATMASTELKWWQKRLGGVGPWPVKKIATHNMPHFDEVLAYVECVTWGRGIFPGVEKARMEFWTEGRVPEDAKGKSGDEILLKDKILPIGIGGGILDEHGKGISSCAHLAAEILQISHKPELQKILQFCKRVDDEGRSMPFDIHSLLNDGWDDCESDKELPAAFDWAVDGIRRHLRGQIRFFKCEDEFREKGRIIKGPVGIAVVESDSRKMNKWIRWRFGDMVDIIIQRRTTGNTAIFTTPDFQRKINFIDVVRIVRMQELVKRKIILPDWQEMEVAEDCDKCHFWYYSKKDKSQLLNGSFSAPDKEPTALSFMEVAGAIALACAPLVDPCKEVKCNGRWCEKYVWGLRKCRDKRFNLYHKKAA